MAKLLLTLAALMCTCTLEASARSTLHVRLRRQSVPPAIISATSNNSTTNGTVSNINGTIDSASSNTVDPYIVIQVNGAAEGDDLASSKLDAIGSVDYKNGSVDAAIASGSQNASGTFVDVEGSVAGAVTKDLVQTTGLQSANVFGTGESKSYQDMTNLLTKYGLPSGGVLSNKVSSYGTQSSGLTSQQFQNRTATADGMSKEVLSLFNAYGMGLKARQAGSINYQDLNGETKGVSSFTNTDGKDSGTAIGSALIYENDTSHVLTAEANGEAVSTDGDASVDNIAKADDNGETVILANGMGDATIGVGDTMANGTQAVIITPESGAEGFGESYATGEGQGHNLTATNVIIADDINGVTVTGGNGNLVSSGNQNTTGYVKADSGYSNGTGFGGVESEGYGSSVNDSSSLNITGTGFWNKPLLGDSINATGDATATAEGEYSDTYGTFAVSASRNCTADDPGYPDDCTVLAGVSTSNATANNTAGLSSANTGNTLTFYNGTDFEEMLAGGSVSDSGDNTSAQSYSTLSRTADVWSAVSKQSGSAQGAGTTWLNMNNWVVSRRRRRRRKRETTAPRTSEGHAVRMSATSGGGQAQTSTVVDEFHKFCLNSADPQSCVWIRKRTRLPAGTVSYTPMTPAAFVRTIVRQSDNELEHRAGAGGSVAAGASAAGSGGTSTRILAISSASASTSNGSGGRSVYVRSHSTYHS